jgi:hypothetical protein
MLIDDSSKIAMLSASMPGMESIHLLLVSIWNKLLEMQSNMK